MYTKTEIRELLDAKGISYEYYEHIPLFTMEDEAAADLPHSEVTAKNVFASDDKRRDYFLITIQGNERVNLKEIGQPWGYRHLRFASAEELQEKLGLISGAVSPLGLLNDENNSIHFFMDSRFLGKDIVVHPNDNTASLFLKTDDLLALLKDRGCEIHTF